MAKRKRLTIAQIVQRAIDRLSLRYRPEPPPKPERPSGKDIIDIVSPPPTIRPPGRGAPPIFTPPVPLADREYHVILEGYGPGWFRPSIADEDDTKDYTIAMQGFIRGGSRKTSQRTHIRRLESVSQSWDMDGEFNGQPITNARFEPSLNAIENYALTEPLGGDGWRSE